MRNSSLKSHKIYKFTITTFKVTNCKLALNCAVNNEVCRLLLLNLLDVT